MNAHTQALVKQMEERAQELYIKLESFRDIEEELGHLRRAIKVLKGEKLGPGRTPKNAAEDSDHTDTPKVPQVKSGAGLLTAMAVLKALGQMPKLSRQRDILEFMGLGADVQSRKKISVLLPYLIHQGHAAVKPMANGHGKYYFITAQGRGRAAQL